MTVLIIASNKDPASINIKNNLLKQTSWNKIDIFNENIVYENSKNKDIILITINDRKINHENLDIEIEKKLKIKAKQAIFISRHTSKTGKPTLTVHPIGNYRKAEFGGKDSILSESSPKLMTRQLRLLKKNAKLSNLYHEVCFEVTHHGPYLSIPSYFIEVGSTEEEWGKEKPAFVIAKSILELLELYLYENDLPNNIPSLVGIGGGHYAPRFTDVIFQKNVAFGHMIPSYHINEGVIEKEIIKETFKKTPNAKGVYIHRKSLKKSHVSELKKIFKNMNIEVISSKNMPNLD
jgi:D-aminoacyl-tRNA deacylase